MSTYEISKSSLLSLKAEILRKQEDISKAKIENEAKIKVLKKVPLEIKNKGVEERSNKDYEEDLDLLKLSKTVLERKTELYEKLSSGTLSEEKKKKYEQVLVRFDKKKNNKVSDVPPSDSESDKRQSESEDDNYYESDEDEAKDPGERWVEYVDSFGRTRKCMEKDLEFLKSKDKEMKKIIHEKKQLNEEDNRKDEEDCSQNVTEDTDISKDTDQMISSDMRRELQRRQWEKEEEENRNKTNIHYEDVLYGEARTHGVGYYGFSRDEEERAKQQEALKKLRKETEDKQKKAQELKETREKLLAARLKAARNRKRARLGLPPEEDEPESITPQPVISEKELQKQKEQEEKERLLEEARQKYVRPWDVGKEGVKEMDVMTQKEWVEKKRKDRPAEFAPPTNYRKNFRAVETIITEDGVESNETLKFSTGKPKNKHKKEKNVLLKSSNKIEKLNQKTQKDTSADIALRNIRQNDQIVDLEDEGIHKRKGVEVAPPSTYDYYGPTSTKIKRSSNTGTNIQESIEAGLKFLRKQVEEKEKSSNIDDMFLF
ncbi:coiled-coil domain-containing protein 174 [Diorhabda sublineata]|uniref:coiled-coil domain-containing protein 174 n=1 Tax=Diorhabda sublineata TaxID=1163346 RepID=UPI0024E0C3F6|nr:coiled-coil domain-containing protein 174 [Diorhabda sublineata]